MKLMLSNFEFYSVRWDLLSLGNGIFGMINFHEKAIRLDSANITSFDELLFVLLHEVNHYIVGIHKIMKYKKKRFFFKGKIQEKILDSFTESYAFIFENNDFNTFVKELWLKKPFLTDEQRKIVTE